MSIDIRKAYNVYKPGNTTALIQPSSGGDMAGITENLNKLALALQYCNKTIKYWDIYKFDASVNNQESFYSTYASLPPNHSLVINCDPFSFGEDTYARGDVVVKKDDGSKLVIPGQNTGLFYPAIYSDSILKFQYVKSLTALTDLTLEPFENPTDPRSAVQWTKNELDGSYVGTLALQEAASNTVYAQEFIWPSTSSANSISYDAGTYTIEFSTIKHNNKSIQPIVKFFYPISNAETKQYEEIFISYNLQDTGDNWTLTFSNAPTKGKVVVK